MITIKLPRRKPLKCESIGKKKKIKFIKPGDLFMFDTQIYEKVVDSCVNLSDLDDIGEPDENEYVEIYKEIE